MVFALSTQITSYLQLKKDDHLIVSSHFGPEFGQKLFAKSGLLTILKQPP